MRVALISSLVAAVIAAGVFARVTEALSAANTRRIEGDVIQAQRELLRASRLEGFDLANQAATFAREDEFVQIFAKPVDKGREQAAYVAVEVRKARLEKPTEGREGEGPARVGIIGVVDEQGLLLARDLQPNWRRHDDLKKDFPSLGVALAGQSNKDVWNLDGGMYRIGAAPIRGPQGNILGAVFVGYVQSTRDAAAERDVIGTDVAFFLDGKIHASSFQRQGDSSSSETAEERALAAQFFDGQRYADKVVNEHKATEVLHIKIGREDWVAAAAPLPGNATSSKSGFIVLASLSAAQSAVAPLGAWILGLGLAAVLLTIGAAVATARRFLNPLDKIEAGVSEVINGNQSYVFESPSPDFEGLANGLNVMLARLLGRPEPGEEDEGDHDKAALGGMEQ